ncbi:MAG: class I SAM-dependent methyltransferase [Actinomycetota bacterium]|nr:class I SAM-dependent methyltransferase [Actinomycetota bacterium]
MNRDDEVVAAFGDEWSRFDQSDLSQADREQAFAKYFGIFPWDRLPSASAGLDIGCGSGRWAAMVAPRVGSLICIDASPEAAKVAEQNLAHLHNCTVVVASVDSLPVAAGSMDFAYSLGVLHHVPDTQAAIRSCAETLKPGAPLLVYLYYSFENRPRWFRALWRISNVLRQTISHSPAAVRNTTCEVIASTVYWPMARAGALGSRLGAHTEGWPLSTYQHMSYYVMRTDARDRFGTRLEQRFSRAEIETMLLAAGLTDITFAEHMPYWCAVGFRAPTE